MAFKSFKSLFFSFQVSGRNLKKQDRAKKKYFTAKYELGIVIEA